MNFDYLRLLTWVSMLLVCVAFWVGVIYAIERLM